MPKTTAQSKTLAAKVHPFQNDAQREAFDAYASAVEAMQLGNYERALDGFRSLGPGAPPEVRERARVHRQACERQVESRSRDLLFQTPVEQYDYAMACIGNSDFDEARDHLRAVVEYNENLDYAHYGLAVLYGMTGQTEDCLQHLQRAIELKPFNRITARNDADFRQMADDPRFTELLYPEAI